MGGGPLEMSFVLSASEVEQLPPSTAEVALAGRSNVGKSSLLNALANRKALARTSNTPGRTRLLNLFEVAGGGTVVDLPGYGYAKASKVDREAWARRTDEYLLEREGLVMVLLLVDGKIGPTDFDVDVLEGMREHDVPVTVVATKHDKVKPSQRERRRRDLAAGCQLDPAEVLWVSAEHGTNLAALRDQVRNWLN